MQKEKNNKKKTINRSYKEKWESEEEEENRPAEVANLRKLLDKK